MSGQGARIPEQVKKWRYRWVLKRSVFNRREKVASSYFKVGLDNSQSMGLQLEYLVESVSKKTYVNIYLYHLVEPPTGVIRVRVKLGIIGNDGQSANVKCHRKVFAGENRWEFWCCEKFIALDSLFEEGNGYFKNNEVTIFCILEVYRNLEIPESNWSNEFSGLLESGEFSDFTLVVGGEELKVHRNVLSSRSPVFQAMFRHVLDENQDGRLEIEDLDVVGVKGMLKYLYTGSVDALSGIAKMVLPAANKYGVDRLKAICEQLLCDKLDDANVMEVLVLADRYSATQLKKQALGYIRVNSGAVFKQAGFKGLLDSNRTLFMEAVGAMANKEVSMKPINIPGT